MKSIRNLRDSFKTRQVKYGGYAVLITLAVIAGLILLNLMVERLAIQADLTESRIYSLSEQSEQVLEGITTPVKFYGLWRPGEESLDVMSVVNLYLAKNSNITFELVDTDRNPGFTMRYQRGSESILRRSLIVEGEKGFRIISPNEMYDMSQNQQGGAVVTAVAVESRITAALLYVGTGTTPVVYEITGHNEIPLANLGMQRTVEMENLSLRPLNLLVASIPPDASALIINAPRTDLTPEEAEKLLQYLDGGGRLLVLLDYNLLLSAYAAEAEGAGAGNNLPGLVNLNVVLASYGLKAESGILYELDSSYMIGDPMTELPDLLPHDITSSLTNKQDTPVVLFRSAAVSTLDVKRQTTEITPLLSSSPQAFLRTNLAITTPVKTVEDTAGPLTLAAAAVDPSWIDPNNPEPQARLVVIGCGSLLPLAAELGFAGNRDLFLNSLGWLGDRPASISVRSKSLFLLPMTLNQTQQTVFGILFIALIPLAFFVTGFITWLKRRHL